MPSKLWWLPAILLCLAPALQTAAAPRGERAHSLHPGHPPSRPPPATEAITTLSYPFTALAGVAVEDMSTGTTQLLGPNLDNTASPVFNIGFLFRFNGVNHEQFSVNADGLLRLGPVAVNPLFFNNLASATNVPQVAAYWDDTHIGTNGQVHAKIVGTAPTRKLVVEWQNMQIPRVGPGNVGLRSWQLWLQETTGVIQFVYGPTFIGTNSGGYSVGFGSSATDFVSVTTSGPSAAYGTANNTQNTALSAGDSYAFTPPLPAAPTNLTFSQVFVGQMTLSWLDQSDNETGFGIFRSTDGVNFVQVADVGPNVTTVAIGRLTPNTMYFWRVEALTEGGRSAPLAGTQATNPITYFGGIVVVGDEKGDFPTIQAAVDYLESVGLGGPGRIAIRGGGPLRTENVLFPPIAGTSATNTLTIGPAAGATGIVIEFDNPEGTMAFDGAEYCILDGRPGGIGTTSEMTVRNTSTAGCALRFVNDAAHNTCRYVTFQGVNTSSSGGVVIFGGTNFPNGNDDNLIEHCTIRDGATTPTNGIYCSGSTGTTAQNNSGLVIRNCDILNFFNANGASNGILLTGGTQDCQIIDCHLYQTAARTALLGTFHTAVNILASGSNGLAVIGCAIGGSAPNAAGAPWTLGGSFANRWRGIHVSAGAGAGNSVVGNRIANMALTSTSGATTLGGPLCGILVTTGNVLVSGNQIGSPTGTGSLVATSSTTGGVSTGIFVSGAGIVADISNNTVGACTTLGSTNGVSHGFHGISCTAATSVNVSGNVVGSATTVQSISAATASTSSTAQTVSGLHLTASSATVTVTNNTIANLSNQAAPAAASSVRQAAGILVNGGSITVSGNTVRNLTVAANAIGTGSNASVVGVASSGASAAATVSQNTIHSLANTHPSAAVEVSGLFHFGPSFATHDVDGNTVHSLAAETFSNFGVVAAITIDGAGLARCYNNQVRLGFDAAGQSVTGGYSIAGLRHLAGQVEIYHNSVYVGGTGGSMAADSYAYLSLVTGTSRNLRNNIFVNARSQGAGGGGQYAIRLGGTGVNPAGLVSDYNVFHAPGLEGRFGFYDGADVPTLGDWETRTGQDANSFEADPRFLAPNGDAATFSLHIAPNLVTPVEGTGIAIPGVTLDIDGQVRASLSPTDIGADAGNFLGSGPQPPVAGTLVLSVPQGFPRIIPHSEILNLGSDPGGFTPLTVLSAGPVSAQGGTIGFSPGVSVNYQPPSPGFTGPDSFSYTIQNTQGTTASGQVQITVVPPAFPPLAASVIRVGTNLTATYRGVPGLTYAIEFSNDLVNAFTPLLDGQGQPVSVVADGSGNFQFQDANALPPERHYRARSP